MLLRPRAAVGRHRGVRSTSHFQGTFGSPSRRVRPVRGVAHSYSPGYSQPRRGIRRNSFAGSCIDRSPRGMRMASKALHASWRRTSSCGVGWICRGICRETNDSAIAITLAAFLCTPLPHACQKIYTSTGPPRSERRRRPCYTRIVPAGLGAPYPSARSVSLAL